MWIKYLEDKKRLTDSQFCFRQGRSCMAKFIFIDWYNIVQERDGRADGIYLDLQKIFDKVTQEIALEDLKLWKSRWIFFLRFMENFLKDIGMKTAVRDSESSWGTVMRGVPEG